MLRAASLTSISELRDFPFELVDVNARGGLAILSAVFDRLAERLVVRGPRRRELAFVLTTEPEVQERAAAGIESLTLGELRARVSEAALVHERDALRRRAFVRAFDPRPSARPRARGETRAKARSRAAARASSYLRSREIPVSTLALGAGGWRVRRSCRVRVDVWSCSDEADGAALCAAAC